MNIQPASNSTTKTSNTDKTNTDKTSTEAAKDKPSAAELSQANRQELNQTILQNQLEISLKSDNKSMSLLYKTITASIEKRLADDDSVAAPEKTTASNPYSQDQDTSPQATADRIVAFATNFYANYRERNQDLTEEAAMDDFMAKIGGGIDQGFADAKDILKGLQQLEGKVASDIDETYELIQQGLQSFREKTLADKAAAQPAVAS
ncbi:hypothetical protein A5320_13215 [Rheinheimera sp. SA_1]|uniref:DUF5610 domain-containing protein n=1 Tax=Rheinheimera sp. SA_1 TaxID=1827365 RepID=UPI000801E537|nr:DUF5610 domain-containing protein [Rheinheimera sp. SA_1]OBP14687.1 hypothetical protein A5320_13215 [Rheinheimera sp. SA_1]